MELDSRFTVRHQKLRFPLRKVRTQDPINLMMEPRPSTPRENLLRVSPSHNGKHTLAIKLNCIDNRNLVERDATPNPSPQPPVQSDAQDKLLQNPGLVTSAGHTVSSPDVNIRKAETEADTSCWGSATSTTKSTTTRWSRSRRVTSIGSQSYRQQVLNTSTHRVDKVSSVYIHFMETIISVFCIALQITKLCRLNL